MAGEELAPGPVAVPRGVLGRAHDVGEEHRPQVACTAGLSPSHHKRTLLTLGGELQGAERLLRERLEGIELGRGRSFDDHHDEPSVT